MWLQHLRWSKISFFVSIYEKMSVKLPKMNDGRGRKHAGHCEITNAFSVVATGVKCHLRAERLMLTVEMMNLQFFQQYAHKSTDSMHTHTHTHCMLKKLPWAHSHKIHHRLIKLYATCLTSCRETPCCVLRVVILWRECKCDTVAAFPQCSAPHLHQRK